jgi:uncharacterized protein YbbC (DUF1343 family)
MTYELTTGFHDDSWEGVPEYVSYTFRPNMTTEEIESWDEFILMNDNILPVIGSRVFNHIYVLEPVISASDDTGGVIKKPFVVMDWIDVQDNSYRYVCWLDKIYMHIMIVIDEFLYAKVVLKQKNSPPK